MFRTVKKILQIFKRDFALHTHLYKNKQTHTQTNKHTVSQMISSLLSGEGQDRTSYVFRTCTPELVYDRYCRVVYC